MKHLLFLIILIASSAPAIIFGPFEKARFEAVLSEVDSQGNPVQTTQHFSLTWNRRDDSPVTPTSFVFCETADAPESLCTFFKVGEPKPESRCAQSYLGYAEDREGHALITIQLVETMGRYCGHDDDSDARKMWHVLITNRESSEKRFFVGEPKPIVRIMDGFRF